MEIDDTKAVLEGKPRLKILVVNIKYLGDLIVSTPGLRALRASRPDGEITMLVRRGYEETVSSNPNLDRVMTFDSKLKGHLTFRKALLAIRFMRLIRNEKFDVFIALHPGDRVALWSWFSGAKLRIGPRNQSFHFLFNKLVDVEEDTISYLEYYNEIFSAYVGRVNSNRTEFLVPAEKLEWADKFLTTNNISPDDILVAIHPGASEPTKMWRGKNFAELIRRLNTDLRIKTLLIEGNQDREICGEILRLADENKVVHFESNSIIRTAALIKRSKLFITHDTGTRHLAVAVRTPVLALLPEDNLRCWNFYEDIDFHHAIIGKRYFPSPDSSERPFLGDISVEDVYSRVGEILGSWQREK